MSKIVLDLSSKKTIDEAILRLKRIKHFQKEMQYEFFQYICEWVIDRANFYLDASDIGEEIKRDIKNSWEYEISNGLSAKIINRNQHAVFVEFGVGSVGSQNSHPNSSKENYKYNSGSQIKGDLWFFSKENNEDVDLKNKYFWRKNSESDTVVTRGSPAVMYAYNAVVDAQMELADNFGVFAKEWNKIVERYIG
jgi:hypothetical protein